MTRLRATLDGQLGAPEGRAGRFVLSVLNLANRGLNHATVDALKLTPGARVLDVGFGGGVGVRRALKAGAEVIAIDPSPAAVSIGRRAFADGVVVRRGDAVRTGEPPGALDAAYAVNTIYFWPDVAAGLRSLHGAIRSGGRLALGVEDRALARRASLRAGLPDDASGLVVTVGAAGFTNVTVATSGSGRTVIVADRA